MNTVNKLYDDFSENRAFAILNRNKDYLDAREKADQIAKELKETMNKVIKLSRRYEDCLSDVACIAYREYFKQGYKLNR